MRKTIIAALMIGAMSLLPNTRLSYGQTPEKTPTDKVSQLAEDFCSQLSRAQTPGQPATDKAAQLANDFCSQLSRAQTSSQPIRLALAQTSNQPILLAQIPGQPAAKEKTFQLADDLHLSVGFRLWFHSWLTGKFFVSPGFFAFPFPVQVSDDNLGYIPTLGVRYKDFFVSASGMFGTDYNFNHTSNPNASRQEVDVNAGYYIHPWIAVSMGYKGVFQTFKPLPGFVKDQNFYNGPTLGLSANVPIPEGGLLPSGFSLYGSGGGGYMWVQQSQCCQWGNHAIYGVMEGGAAYKPSQLPLVFTAGYKYQILNNKFKNHFGSPFGAQFATPDSNDVTRGPLIGISLVF